MKVRWTKQSVRLRITPGELMQLQREQVVGEAFSCSGALGWQVLVVPLPHVSSDATSLSMQNGVLTFALSSTDLVKLGEPQREGVYFSQDEIRFYIEKDFPCAHPRAGESEETPTPTFNAPQGFEDRKNP